MENYWQKGMHELNLKIITTYNSMDYQSLRLFSLDLFSVSVVPVNKANQPSMHSNNSGCHDLYLCGSFLQLIKPLVRKSRTHG
jgi:hypothetical protein